jgi:hypothetical protein
MFREFVFVRDFILYGDVRYHVVAVFVGTTNLGAAREAQAYGKLAKQVRQSNGLPDDIFIASQDDLIRSPRFYADHFTREEYLAICRCEFAVAVTVGPNEFVADVNAGRKMPDDYDATACVGSLLDAIQAATLLA